MQLCSSVSFSKPERGTSEQCWPYWSFPPPPLCPGTARRGRTNTSANRTPVSTYSMLVGPQACNTCLVWACHQATGVTQHLMNITSVWRVWFSRKRNSPPLGIEAVLWINYKFLDLWEKERCCPEQTNSGLWTLKINDLSLIGRVESYTGIWSHHSGLGRRYRNAVKGVSVTQQRVKHNRRKSPVSYHLIIFILSLHPHLSC